MKHLLPLALFLSSCVTSQDIRDVADSVARLEAVAQDTTKTTAEVQEQIATTKEEVEEVAERIEERSAGVVETIASAEGGAAGLISLAVALGLNAYRNHTRKKVLPPPPA